MSTRLGARKKGKEEKDLTERKGDPSALEARGGGGRKSERAGGVNAKVILAGLQWYFSLHESHKSQM